MKKILLIVSVVSMTLFSAAAQSKLSNSTRIFLSEVEADTMYQSMPTKTLLRSAAKANGKELVQVFVHFYNNVDVALLESYDVIVESVFEKTQVATCRATYDVLQSLSEEDAVRYVEMATPVEKRMDQARILSYANDVINGAAPLTMPYLGKNVVVGIVDHGFQYNHAAFYDKIHSNLRVKRVWNQNSNIGSRPDDYDRGVEYTTSDAIIKAKYDDRSDDVGHGTHVAGIAAGADHADGNPYYGIAQESDLVFVSYYLYSQSNADLSNAVKYVYDYADEVKKPAVVNLSLGSHLGPHDGTSTFDRIIDDMVGPGRLVVGACGNEGSDKFHVHKDFNEETNDTLLHTFFDYWTKDYRAGIADMWGDSAYKFRIVVYNKLISSYGGKGYKYVSDYYNIEDYVNKNVDIRPLFKFEDKTILAGRVQGAVEKNPFNDKYHVELRLSCTTQVNSSCLMGIEIVASDGTVHIWADDQRMGLTNMKLSDWTDGNAQYSVGEIGGSGKHMIAVGAYVSNTNVPGYSKAGFIGDKTTFSSMGPTADGRIKPNISAPGCAVASSVPNTIAVTGGYAYNEAKITNVDGEKFHYSYMQGTSMSSPFVTGTIATWLQANPQLTYDEIIETFEKTALRDQYYGNEIPNINFGYGRIDAYQGLLYTLRLPTSVADATMPSTMMVYPNPTSGEFNLGFTRADSNVNIAVYSINGQIVYNKQLKLTAAGESVVVSLDNVENGAYVVRVSGDAANETYRLIVAK